MEPVESVFGQSTALGEVHSPRRGRGYHTPMPTARGRGDIYRLQDRKCLFAYPPREPQKQRVRMRDRRDAARGGEEPADLTDEFHIMCTSHCKAMALPTSRATIRLMSPGTTAHASVSLKRTGMRVRPRWPPRILDLFILVPVCPRRIAATPGPVRGDGNTHILSWHGSIRARGEERAAEKANTSQRKKEKRC
eukprot:scaffold3787_cov221-Prasinococcus_capsulatus_cf.AAC.1